MDISDTDLAWAAGFIDGEGCIALVHHKQNIKGKVYESFVLRLSVANTDALCLDRLKTMFGGSINSSNRASRPHHKPCWVWYCQSAKAEVALQKLMPFLFSKKTQAQLGITSRKYIQSHARLRDPVEFEKQRGIYNNLKLMKRAA